jgi:MFS transporter, FSR family, fosmidomycin resistance protein
MFGSATGLPVLVLAACLSWSASGAFVGLAQATWMNLEPATTERNMATWVVAGSVGSVLGPVVLGVAAAVGFGWRVAVLFGAALTIPVLLAASNLRFPEPHPEVTGLWTAFGGAVRALRMRSVLRWLTLLELTDLLQDVFLGYVAVYLVDVGGASAVVAAGGVAILTGSVLAGDVILVHVLRRVDGVRYLRWSALLMLTAYPAFLLAGALTAKLALLVPVGVLRAGWYAILEARLFAELPGRGGTIQAIKSPVNLAGASLPLAIGLAAHRFGIGPAMWFLLVAPAALLILLPRRPGRARVARRPASPRRPGDPSPAARPGRRRPES